MCGLNAIYAYHRTAPPIDRDELRRTRDHMAARGPDGKGEWFSDDGRVALGHRRLAIIDPRPESNQPMLGADGTCVISFNGEIYNYRALRAELVAQGERFRTTSDTEVLLALYARDGERMFAKLRGMYAFVLWDAPRRRMLLARDPYGIKPLYYADDGRSVRVASQVKALLAGGGVSRQVEPAGLVGFLLFGSVPEPFTCQRDVHAVPAGSWMIVDEHGPSRPQPHFELARVYRDGRGPPVRREDAIEAAQAAFRDSVAHHLVADVPVGAFLSGGIDSGSIVGLMRDQSPEPLRTVTVRFDEYLGTAADEAPLAEVTAQRYQADHRNRIVTESEFRTDLPRILAAMDQPSIDGMNTWFAAKACHERGLKVALSGLGGDELLGSYPSFSSLPRWVALMAGPTRIPVLGKALRRLLAPLLARQSHFSPKLAGVAELAGTWDGAYLLRRGLFMPWELPDVLPHDILREGLERLNWRRLVGAVIQPDPGSKFARVSCLESGLYMRNQLLRDTDWAGMAHSLEVRTPLVDSILACAMAAVAPFVQGGDSKRWLANAPSTSLPPSVIAKRKTGFQTPIGVWSQRAPGFDAWRSHAGLASKAQHWSRRLSVNLLHSFGLVEVPTTHVGRVARMSAVPSHRVVAPVDQSAMPAANTPKIIHFQRRPFPASHSIERISQDLRDGLRTLGVQVELRLNRYYSKGMLARAADAMSAALHQGDINHVTGDVHYLTYFLDPKRTILTVHDCVGLHYMTGLKRALFRLLWYRLPLRRCRYITVISEFTKRDLLNTVRIGEDKVVVIHVPVSDEFVHEPAEFNAACPRILQIGTNSNKNVERVAQALRGLRCKLVVVGPLDPQQRACIEGEGIDFVNLVGLSREELRAEYARSDLVAFASTFEGFGLPIIEANATGRPVITSTVCSMPEVAADAACLVDPYHAESIRQGVLRVIGDAAYRAELIRNGLINAERFRIPNIARQYADLYRRVLDENRAHDARAAWNRSAH